MKALLKAMKATFRALLTPNEIRIMKLVAGGKTSREIAEILNRSIRTIENHRQLIYVKLDVHTAAEAVKVCMHEQLIN